MKKIYGVITSSGDGSNSIRWFKRVPYETLKNLDEVSGDYEYWGSGDGVQIETLVFPDSLNIDDIGINFDDDVFFDSDNKYIED